jgi:hypothetical protein
MEKSKKVKTSRVSKPRKSKFLQTGKTYILQYTDKNGEHFKNITCFKTKKI